MNGKPSKPPAADFDEKINRYLNPEADEELSMLDDNEFELVDEDEEDAEAQNTAHEEAELKKEISKMRGDIMESRIIKGGHILAIVKVEEDDKGINKGLYLALKIKGEKLLIYGDEHADKLDVNAIKWAYEGIDSMPLFLEESAKFKEGLNMYLEEGAESKENLDALQKEKVEKMQDE